MYLLRIPIPTIEITAGSVRKLLERKQRPASQQSAAFYRRSTLDEKAETYFRLPTVRHIFFRIVQTTRKMGTISMLRRTPERGPCLTQQARLQP